VAAEQLKDDPAWESAARSFVAGIATLPTRDERVRLIEQVWAELGDMLYPAFIKILCAIAHWGDASARRLTAEALAHALATARLPSGPTPAWGSSSWSPLPAGAPGAGWHARPARNLGPLEFLCVWHAQRGAEGRLDQQDFAYAVRKIIELFDAAPEAAALYSAKLLDDVANPIEGAFSRQTRALIASIAHDWSAHLPAETIVARAIGSAPKEDPFGQPEWVQR
jgi:hypothetical protein